MIHLKYDFKLEGWDETPASRLSYYRELRDMSRSRLSEMTGVAVGELQNYESGKQDIYYSVAVKLSEALRINVSLLLDDYAAFLAPGYGKKIKAIREKTGLSQKAFAERLGINRGTVAIWEIEHHHPSRKNYEILRKVKPRGVV